MGVCPRRGASKLPARSESHRDVRFPIEMWNHRGLRGFVISQSLRRAIQLLQAEMHPPGMQEICGAIGKSARTGRDEGIFAQDGGMLLGLESRVKPVHFLLEFLLRPCGFARPKDRK